MEVKHIYHRIADKLGHKYTSTGLLPRAIAPWEAVEDPAWRVSGNYMFIIYRKFHHAFYYAAWDGDSDENIHIICDADTPIDFATGLREVWNMLDQGERMELMAAVLEATDDTYL